MKDIPVYRGKKISIVKVSGFLSKADLKEISEVQSMLGEVYNKVNNG